MAQKSNDEVEFTSKCNIHLIFTPSMNKQSGKGGKVNYGLTIQGVTRNNFYSYQIAHSSHIVSGFFHEEGDIVIK